MANIGNKELAEMALEHENAGKRKDYLYIDSCYEELIELYDIALLEISKMSRCADGMGDCGESIDPYEVLAASKIHQRSEDEAKLSQDDFDAEALLMSVLEEEKPFGVDELVEFLIDIQKLLNSFELDDSLNMITELNNKAVGSEYEAIISVMKEKMECMDVDGVREQIAELSKLL